MAIIQNPGRSRSRTGGTGVTRNKVVGQSMSTRTRDRVRRDAYNYYRRRSTGGKGG
jgi:hypothetical protein